MQTFYSISGLMPITTRFVWGDIDILGTIEQQTNEKEALNALREEINVYEGNLTWEKYSRMEKKPEVVKGNVWFHDAPPAELEKATLPKEIYGDLLLGLPSIKLDFVLPDKVTGSIYFPRMRNEFDEKNGLQEFVRRYSLQKNEEGDGYLLPEKITSKKEEEKWIPKQSEIEEAYIEKRSGPETHITSQDFRNTYRKLHGFPKMVTGDFLLKGLMGTEIDDLQKMGFPIEVNGTVRIEGLKSGKGIVLPKRIRDGLYLEDLISAEGMVFPDTVGASVWLSKLPSGKGLDLSHTVITGNLYMNELVSIEDLQLQKAIDGHIELKGLSESEIIKLQETYDLRPRQRRGTYEYRGRKESKGESK